MEVLKSENVETAGSRLIAKRIMLSNFQAKQKGIIMDKYLIKNTTKEERIALIKEWIPDDEAMDESEIDLWDMYADYINGTKEIAECNAAFKPVYYEE